MTYEEMVVEIPKLSTKERLVLIELLSKSLQSETARLETQEAVTKRLFGSLRGEGEPPTDEELHNDYVGYLERKYA